MKLFWVGPLLVHDAFFILRLTKRSSYTSQTAGKHSLQGLPVGQPVLWIRNDLLRLWFRIQIWNRIQQFEKIVNILSVRSSIVSQKVGLLFLNFLLLFSNFCRILNLNPALLRQKVAISGSSSTTLRPAPFGGTG
jgi:hypothetical protein